VASSKSHEAKRRRADDEGQRAALENVGMLAAFGKFGKRGSASDFTASINLTVSIEAVGNFPEGKP
jgi:hypothetical protein